MFDFVFAELLEPRRVFAAPATPVIIEPLTNGQITSTFDINLQTNPDLYSDPDGHAWQATEWRIRQVSTNQVVWQTGFLSAPPLTLYRTDFSDGQFVGALAGQNQLTYSTNYQLLVRYRDSNGEVSAEAVRSFATAGPTQPVPGEGLWLARPGYVVEQVQTNLRLAVNIAFVPNPGPNPSDPLYYVSELYGSIKVVRRDGTMSTFATSLLDYNPQGPFGGSGEQGLTGLAVERDSANPDIYNLYVAMLWDNGAPPGGPNHYPKVERITTAAGGLTMASRTVLLNMQPETQGQSHQISNVTIGPDDKLYVHMGDGFNSGTALNLDQYRGKILRMNKNGTPVATGDPAGANPFYNAANGINARDYVYAYGFRNPFGGAWRPGTTQHWVAENGNSIDRLVDVTSGQNLGWNGNDSTLQQFSKYVWNPITAPVNIDFVASQRFGGSMFPAEAQGHAYVSLSGSTYAAGPQAISKAIAEFPDLDTLNGQGKLAVPPSILVRYNGTGRGTVVALAAGPDGLYFSDFYEDTGASGATAIGSKIWRVRFVGNPAALQLTDFSAQTPFVSFTLDGTVDAPSLAAGDLQITRLEDGSTLNTATAVQLSGDARTMTFTLPPDLADGNYRFRIPIGAINVNGGTANGVNYDMTGLNVYFLAGDFNRDRSVTIGDFSILAANFNQPGTLSTGDANYDGQVNITDFALMASRFNVTLPTAGDLPRTASQSPVASSAPTSPMKSVFASKAISESVLFETQDDFVVL